MIEFLKGSASELSTNPPNLFWPMVGSMRKESLFMCVYGGGGGWFRREGRRNFRSKAQQQAPITAPVPLDCHYVFLYLSPLLDCEFMKGGYSVFLS